jgi:hypothetical protein
MTKLVYIGGYGHSGSTLAEYLMTGSPQVVACGEVASAARERMGKTACTCGTLAKDCPVWGPFAGPGSSQTRWRHRDLALALLRRASPGYTVLTDSSKTAWHSAAAPFGLRRSLGNDFALVHIVRDPRAVCWAALKKAERQGSRPNTALRCTVAALGWWVANLACELFGWMHPNQYVRLRYEDLARAPREEASALLTAIAPDGSCIFDAPGTVPNRHQLYGNRMRSRPPALAEIREDQAWRAEMPRRHQRLVEALTWPLRGKFGYYQVPEATGRVPSRPDLS